MNKLKAYWQLIKLLPKRFRTTIQLARLFYIITKIKEGLKKAKKEDAK